MDLFYKESAYIKYNYDATHENIEGFDLILFVNENTAIRIAATYTDREVKLINENYMLRTLELIDKRVGYPYWLEMFTKDIEEYNFKEIPVQDAKTIIKEAANNIIDLL